MRVSDALRGSGRGHRLVCRWHRPGYSVAGHWCSLCRRQTYTYYPYYAYYKIHYGSMMVVYAGSIYGTQVMVSDRPSWGAGVSWISRTLSQCDKQICVIWKTRAGRFWIFWEVAWRLTSSNHKSWIPPWTASYCTQPEINVANFPRVGAGGKMLGSFKLTSQPTPTTSQKSCTKGWCSTSSRHNMYIPKSSKNNLLIF